MIAEKPNIDPNGRYSVYQAAAALGVNPTTVYRYINRGILKPRRHAATGFIRFLGSELLRLWSNVKQY